MLLKTLYKDLWHSINVSACSEYNNMCSRGIVACRPFYCLENVIVLIINHVLLRNSDVMIIEALLNILS